MFDEEQTYRYALVRLGAATTEYARSTYDAACAVGTEAREALARWHAARGGYLVAMAEADDAFDAFLASI